MIIQNLKAAIVTVQLGQHVAVTLQPNGQDGDSATVAETADVLADVNSWVKAGIIQIVSAAGAVLGDVDVPASKLLLGTGLPEVRTAATLSTNLTGANNDLTFTAVTKGTDGNDITVTYVNPATPSAALSVDVTGTDITVNLATSAGTAQVETATAAGTITLSGDATVVVTGAGITGSPVTLSVAVLDTDTAATWAGKVRTALLANGPITALYTVGGSTTAISLTEIVPNGNDGTLNISLGNGTCTGITTAATSANATAGVAPAITSTGADVRDAVNDDADASALVTAAHKTANTGVGVVTAMAEDSLTGGLDGAQYVTVNGEEFGWVTEAGDELDDTRTEVLVGANVSAAFANLRTAINANTVLDGLEVKAVGLEVVNASNDARLMVRGIGDTDVVMTESSGNMTISTIAAVDRKAGRPVFGNVVAAGTTLLIDTGLSEVDYWLIQVKDTNGQIILWDGTVEVTDGFLYLSDTGSTHLANTNVVTFFAQGN